MYPDLITEIQKLERELNATALSPAGRTHRLVELGRLYEKNGRDQQAADVWVQAITLAGAAPPTADLLCCAGDAHLELGQMMEAHTCYERAAALAPSHPLPPVGLAETARQQGHLAHALVVLQQAVVDHPQAAVTHSELGHLYKLLKKPERAITCLEIAVRSDYRWSVPPDTPPEGQETYVMRRRAIDYQRLGSVCAAMRREEEAITAFEAALACYPRFAPPHNSLGALHARNGAYEEAIRHFEQALIIGNLPHDVLARIYNGLGNVYYLVGRLQDAVEAFQQAVALNYRYALPYNGLGNVYRAQGRYAAARRVYERAAELDPGYGAPFCGLGTLNLLEDHVKPAIVAFQKAIARSPHDPLAYCGLATLYQLHGRERDARTQLDLAAPLVAEDTTYNRACFAAAAGRHQEALQLLEAALRRAPGLRAWAQRDPDFLQLQGDPEFKKVVGKSDPAVVADSG